LQSANFVDCLAFFHVTKIIATLKLNKFIFHKTSFFHSTFLVVCNQQF